MKASTYGFLLVIPTVILVFITLLYPLGYALNMSVRSMNLLRPHPEKFVGLANYFSTFKDEEFWRSLGRTAYFVGLTVPIEIFLGMLIALLLNKEFLGRGFVRGLVILPWALPTVVNGVMWKWIYNANYGALNALLTQTRIISEYRNWLGTPWSAMNSLIFADIWKETSFAIILILAALQSIPKELYEAAKIDGANTFIIFRKITFPLIKPTILVLFVIKTIWAIREFDLVSVVTRGGPANGTQTIAYYIYMKTFKFLQFGEGSAMAYFLMFITLLLAMFYIRLMTSGRKI